LSVLEERWRSDRSPRVFLQLADELRRAGRAGRALEVLRDGLKWHPESVSGWVALGRLLLDEGESAAAIEAFDRALERDPGQVVAAKLSTESWIRVGDVERATASLERARLLSLPDADLEQLAAGIVALRPRFTPADTAAAESRPAPAAPFDLGPPPSLPALDLDRLPSGRRSWRRVALAAEPFAGLLVAPASRRRIDAALRDGGIFGAPESSALAALASEAAVPAIAIEPPVGRSEFLQTEAGPLKEIAPRASAVEVGEAPEPAMAAPTPPAAPLAAAPPEVAIFRTYSIGEEVERETALEAVTAAETPAEPEPVAESEPAAGPEPVAAPAATTTLATLYLAQGHLDEAEGEFRKVLAERPGEPEALLGLAQVAERRAHAAAFAAIPEPAAPPPGLTARRVRRLRRLYEGLRARRREERARVS
jgi:tetratricopeptide (TPR) repeat protein